MPNIVLVGIMLIMLILTGRYAEKKLFRIHFQSLTRLDLLRAHPKGGFQEIELMVILHSFIYF